jgi:hypothetical protein
MWSVWQQGRVSQVDHLDPVGDDPGIPDPHDPLPLDQDRRRAAGPVLLAVDQPAAQHGKRRTVVARPQGRSSRCRQEDQSGNGGKENDDRDRKTTCPFHERLLRGEAASYILAAMPIHSSRTVDSRGFPPIQFIALIHVST